MLHGSQQASPRSWDWYDIRLACVVLLLVFVCGLVMKMRNFRFAYVHPSMTPPQAPAGDFVRGYRIRTDEVVGAVTGSALFPRREALEKLHWKERHGIYPTLTSTQIREAADAYGRSKIYLFGIAAAFLDGFFLMPLYIHEAYWGGPKRNKAGGHSPQLPEQNRKMGKNTLKGRRRQVR